MIGLEHYLAVASALFVIGIFGLFLNRKNVIVILMSIELILLAVNINLVAFSVHLGDLVGQVFTLFVLTVAAADDNGFVGTASARVVADTPPAVEWEAPGEGAILPVGAPVALTVQVSDAPTAPAGLTVAVASDVDGPRGGASPDAEGWVRLSFFLSLGAHTLTLTAQDAQGLTSVLHRDVVLQ